ncbi:MAG TPA: hypothetical protein VJ862_11695 [Rhodanobacteraceae bacterium]|nr:hypothetical protein [Rhodanobacteraceae bacterium]
MQKRTILLRGGNMNTFSNPDLAAVAPASAARDIVRIVIVAALAGTGFAILLALAVLSLTVIAPPAIASGGAAVVSSEPAQGARATADTPLDRASANFIGEAVAAQPAPASVPLTRGEAAADDSVLGMPKLAVLALVLALLAGVAAFLVRARGRQ